MPPRAAKKAAAKKPSPRTRRSPLTASPATSAGALPTVEEEEEKALEAQASPSVAGQEDNVEADEKMSLEQEGSLPEAGVCLSPAANGEDEGAEGEKAAAAEVIAPAAVEEGAPLPKTEDVGEADDLQEMVEDPEASVESEVEPLASTETAEEEERPEVFTEVKGAEKSIVEKGTVSKVEGSEACGFEVGDAAGGVMSGSDNGSDNGEDEDEVDPSMYMNAPMTDRKSNKESEIFVGGLGKEAVEDDLLNVFGEFGEIQSARIVKHPKTQKSKGFAFIRYATVEQAKKALAEFKDGTEIRGKRVGISASVDNDTLYLGNICKTWTKDHVLETLKGFGVSTEEVLLPDDPQKEGNNKGFAFLEFDSHSDAMAAFQRLRKPDAIFGCDRSAKVAFAQFSMHPSEEVMSQVKSVYLEGLPLTWDEEKVKEMCKQYGDIEKVQLSRNFRKKKRKDFGFVAFTSHENAVACVEGINDAELGEEDIKVKASLAKPQRKGRLAKQGVRGGFKVEKNGEVAKEAGQSKAKSQAKAEGTHGKEKSLPKIKGTKDKNSSESKGKAVGGKNNAQYRQKNVEPQRDGKRGRKGMSIDNNTRPSKKARSDLNLHTRPSGGFGSKRSAHHRIMRTSDVAHPITHASHYAEPASGYQPYGYAGASGSKHRHSDLEPHAGYLPAPRRGPDSYGYAQRSTAAYENQQRINSGAYDDQETISAVGYDDQRRTYSGGYGNQQRPIVGGYNNPQRIGAVYPAAGLELRSSYTGYSEYSGYEAGYPYSNAGAYAPQGPYY
uniref:Heterogeneous nuclear ribonucleoprotein Q n=1 Tax=Anthurium amnicola TaxID=1678845 RepID=A0A1D1XE69_9ARAE